MVLPGGNWMRSPGVGRRVRQKVQICAGEEGGSARRDCGLACTRYPFLAPSTSFMSEISQRSQRALCLVLLTSRFGTAHAPQPPARLVFDTMPAARFEFQGPIDDRIKANVDNWLLRAPEANPGMLEMFRLRDREPVPQLVPWAGEFVGKYLISAVQAGQRWFPPSSNRSWAPGRTTHVGNRPMDKFERTVYGLIL
jgi:hypothetical protein